MIDLSKLSSSEKIFIKEFEIYNSAIEVYSHTNDYDIFRTELRKMSDEYLNLLQQAVKLVKVSDSTQLNLRNAKVKLKEQNDKIAFQNDELSKSNLIQEKLLNVINRELSRAADYVKSILPTPLDNNTNAVNIDWRFVPSSKLGGDMFGYKELDKDNLAVYLIDVCGHGVQAALYSVAVMNTLNYRSLPDTDFYNPVSVFTELNKMFDMRKHNELYFTIWYGVYNYKTRELKYSSAGHPPAVYIKNKQDLKLLESDNFFIGGFQGYKFESGNCILNVNDNIYIYSDGGYEIRKNETEFMTIEELGNFLLANNDKPDSMDLLYEHIKDINYDNTLEDDFTILKMSIVK